jgi:nucleotide-binding universal stress UspA family protein
MMFEKILVCLDGSELAEQVLPYAIEEARRFDARVSLLHVLLEPVMVTGGLPGGPEHLETPSLPEQMKKEQKQAQAYLERVSERLREQGVTAEMVLLQGAPGDAIVSYAIDNNIGLIAMATHGRSGVGRALAGSVAEHVLRNSGLPLLVVRPGPLGSSK